MDQGSGTTTTSVWSKVTTSPEFRNIQDIATCWKRDVLVVELKNKSLFRDELVNQGFKIEPYFTNSINNVTDMYYVTRRTIGATRAGEIKPRTVGGDIATLWRTNENADVTFSVEGKTITAHKLILTCRSDYFAKMFSNEWKEGDGSKIEIKDTKHDVFEAFLFYIYHDEVKFLDDEYENIFDLMKLADSYCDITIRRECERILIHNIDEDNAFFLVRNAASANASALESTVVQYIFENGLLADKSSPQELIDLVGMEAFQKLAMAAIYHCSIVRDRGVQQEF
ncbi:TD and POZ domain-containing protein 1-like [Folsomia candida]|nr:TD and POZ domain-containing protein 1-like [Folsomia candida]